MTRPDVSLITPYPDLAGSHHEGSSGVASYAANLARSLRARGAQVHVVAPVRDRSEVAVQHDGPGITVERAFRAGPLGLRNAARAVVAGGAPVAHLQFELFLYGGPAAIGGAVGVLRSLRRRRTSTVVTLHQAVVPAEVDRGYRELHRIPVPAPLARFGIQSAQAAISGAATATVVHEAPFRQVIPLATVIPHGIEIAPDDDRDAARRALGLDDRFVALCFGFLAPYKGLEVALEAAERAGDDVLAVVAGGPHPRLAAAGDRYADDLADRHGHHARFTGWVPGDDVARWFRAADVAIFPYPRPFSSSGALALALAHGTPMLLSAPMARCIGAPSALVAADAGELARRLRHLAHEAAARADLQRWTACLAQGREWPEVADRHLALYSEIAR